MKIPEAFEARKAGKYGKHIFPCCKAIKHDAFKKDPLFQEPNTVVIDGIKYGDGKQRALWLLSLQRGIAYTNNTTPIQGFYHKHKEGQLYCYPYRDYNERELPENILTELRIKYPELKHSGCCICPVLVVFNNEIKDERCDMSMKYWHKLCGQKTLF